MAAKAPRKGPKLYVVRWSPNHHKVYDLKREAEDHCRAWKDFKEEAGWSTSAAKTLDGGYVARAPDYDAGLGHYNDPTRFQVCIIEVYERATKRRVWPVWKPKAEPKPKDPDAPKKPRKGRKPVGA